MFSKDSTVVEPPVRGLPKNKYSSPKPEQDFKA